MTDTPPSPHRYVVATADAFIRSASVDEERRYLDYWKTIEPKTDWEYYLRWVFGFASIHTTWRSNVKCYQAVEALGLDYDLNDVKAAIKSSGAGLDKMRSFAIWEFKNKFKANPEWFRPRDGETLPQCRDRLAFSTFGIGQAKTSFVLEMCFPALCDVVCLDTHLLQLYGVNPKNKLTKSQYHAVEAHWAGLCAERGLSCPMVRHMYWDKKMRQEDCRYWSFVFEKG